MKDVVGLLLKDINKCVLYQNINKNKPAQNNNIDFFDKNVKPVKAKTIL